MFLEKKDEMEIRREKRQERQFEKDVGIQSSLCGLPYDIAFWPTPKSAEPPRQDLLRVHKAISNALRLFMFEPLFLFNKHLFSGVHGALASP